MAGNSWQQPVAGQYSVGSLHYCTSVTVVGGADPASTGTWVTSLSAHTPEGCKAVDLRLIVGSGTTAGRTLSIRDPGDAWSTIIASNPSTSVQGRGNGVGFLDSSRNLRWTVNNSDVDSVSIILNGYYI